MRNKIANFLLEAILVVTFLGAANAMIPGWFGALFLTVSYYFYGMLNRASGWREGVRYQEELQRTLAQNRSNGSPKAS